MDPDYAMFIVRSSQAVGYMFVSAGTLMVYDTLLVLPREVNHIWKAKWTVPKVLYILSRYWGIVVLFTDLSAFTQLQTSVPWCRRFLVYMMTVGSTSTLSLLVNIILIMRLYALYSRSARVLAFLILVFLVDLALTIVTVVYILPLSYATMFVAPAAMPLLGCVSAPDLTMSIYSWLGAVSTAIILFLMMAVKLLKNNQAMPRQPHVESQTKVPPLLLAFYRDGTMVFFLIMSVAIIGFIMCYTVEGPLQISYMPWTIVINSICGSRLILHLREAASDEHRTYDTIGSRPTNGQSTRSVRFNRPSETDHSTKGSRQFSIPAEPISVTVVKQVQLRHDAAHGV